MTHDQEREAFDEIIRDIRNYASAVNCGLSCSCGECGQCDQLQLDPNTFADRLEAWQAAKREPVVSGDAVAYVAEQELARYKSGRGGPWLCASVENEQRSIPLFTHPPEAMAKDAERYRFLRDTQATIIYKRNAAGGTWEPLIDTSETSTRCGSLDEATDKAMAEATTPRGG